MTAPTIVWNHLNRSANERGLASGWIGYDGTPGLRVLAFGGFCTGTEESASTEATCPYGALWTNKNTTDAATGTPATPLVGTSFGYDSGADSTYGIATFAAPPGTFLRVHMWALVEYVE